jgi:hypothetical protein
VLASRLQFVKNDLAWFHVIALLVPSTLDNLIEIWNSKPKVFKFKASY